MNDESLTITFTTDRTTEETFAAINDVRGWWSGEIGGPTGELGAEFTYRYGDIHRSTQRITELVPGRRIAWHVTDGHLNLVADSSEWTGTDITSDIIATADGTQVRFTHVGLVPQQECFDSCSPAWTYYVATSLHDRIAAAPA